MLMKNSSDNIRNQIRDLWACSLVPLPTAPMHTPMNYYKPSFFSLGSVCVGGLLVVVTKDSQYLMTFFSYSGFAPIPVETGGSAPAATSSSEELGPSAGSAVQTSTSRPKEDPAPTAPPSSATPQKMNGEYEYKFSCPISMISVHVYFLPIVISKYTCCGALSWYT